MHPYRLVIMTVRKIYIPHMISSLKRVVSAYKQTHIDHNLDVGWIKKLDKEFQSKTKSLGPIGLNYLVSQNRNCFFIWIR